MMRRVVPRWRKMTWVLVIWSVLMLVWVIAAGAGSSESVDECVRDSGGLLTKQDCQDAVDAGTGIGVAIIFVLWALGFVVLGLVWVMSRPRRESDERTAQIVAEALRQDRERRSGDGEQTAARVE